MFLLSPLTRSTPTAHLISQDDFSACYVCFHRNSSHVGSFSKDFFHLKQHGEMSKIQVIERTCNLTLRDYEYLCPSGLERAFLEVGVQTRLPNLAFGHSGDVEGYSFQTEFAKKCSYLHVLDLLAKLTEQGTLLTHYCF